MHTPENKIDYVEIANGIGKWIERSYGYFGNKNSDRNKIDKDFAEQLKRLPVGAMAYIKQIENDFIDSGIKYPPSPATFIQDLKILFNKIKTKNGYIDVISSDYFGKKYVNTFTNNGKFISRTSLKN
jgi:hypothetical protein